MGSGEGPQLELVAMQLGLAEISFPENRGYQRQGQVEIAAHMGDQGLVFSGALRKSGFAGVRAVAEVAVFSTAINAAGGALVARASSVFAPGG